MGFSKSNGTAIALGAVILLALVSIIRQIRPEGPAFEVREFGGMGGFSANKVVEFLGPEKEVVVILFDESSRLVFGKDEYALIETLKQYRYRIKATETIPAGSLLTDPEVAENGVLPMESYLDLARKHSGADAIISFVGPPVPVPDSALAREESAPRLLIARSLADAASRKLVESGFASLAIVQRRPDAEFPASAMGARAANPFELMLEVVTADQ
jgi:hypothetical protein